MKLTPEQQEIVADNHGLIYWYINKYHIDEEEYYGLLAITLCQSILTHDAEKGGSLSNYFKQRADWTMCKEYTKKKTQKRSHKKVQYIENIHDQEEPSDLEKYAELMDWIESDETGVLDLKSKGFSQIEIAEKLGLNKRTVSRILSKKKEEYTLDRQENE